ncbi:FecCD family ABC transporter permease [Celeribacter indicus]|uniref:Transport system permease n=1 Tax=Celeribacter indicus TaxID=1208324 RepID=A0A0B5E6T8_9RHOB|nr:iron ABC transporter permease [Celeribacter indicus]AJE48701.1 transport system permease [Celeribacter indicus]SDX12596.1 iron complex transport system permease protein [Celeribacter indicus]
MRPVLTLLLALLVVSVVALAGGRDWLSPAELWRGLWSGEDFVIHVLRGPRVLLAIGAGASLGLAGALMQGLTRNPLATPDVIGLVQGAGLGHMLALSAGLPLLTGEMLGAICALAVVSVLARGQGPVAFVLYGIGTGATAAAATTVLLLRAPEAQAGQMMLWLSGSLARADPGTAGPLFAVLSGAVIVTVWQAHRLNTLWLGDDVMRGLGVGLGGVRLMSLAVVALLTAGATLAVGPVGFLAFTAAPLARAVTGAQPPALLPAALMGACLLTTADLAARLIAPLVTLPTGLVMTLIGAPYLIWFLAREKRRLAL